MTDDTQNGADRAVTSPTWMAALQAAIVGVVAGLVLNGLLALAGAATSGATAAPQAPRECKKASPARESVSPKPDETPAAGVRS